MSVGAAARHQFAGERRTVPWSRDGGGYVAAVMVEATPYLVEQPGALRRRWEQCPPAGLRRAATPRWHLERWKRVRELIAGWYSVAGTGGPGIDGLIDDLCGDLDPVQRDIVSRLFRNWTAMYPADDGDVDLDPPPVSVFDHARQIELTVRPTVSIRRSREIEHVRLRTGRAATNPDEAAVLTDGAGPHEVFVDALVSIGAAEEIVRPADADRRIEALFDLAAADRRTALRPGRWCFGCDSSARCGRYPVLAPERVYVSTRAITLSKTQLGGIGECERRVAWSSVHQIPGGDQPGTSEAAAAGIRFHELVAAASFAEDPLEVLEAHCARVEPAAASELRRLWANHRTLIGDERVEVRKTELAAGLTLVTDGLHVDWRGTERRQPVAVTLIGILDMTGREADGTPAVIEHRTGRSGGAGALEPELYAAASVALASQFAPPPSGVAVHFHHVGPTEPACQRMVFDREDLDTAEVQLRSAAAKAANWHPVNALGPSWTVGDWCRSCPFEEPCSANR